VGGCNSAGRRRFLSRSSARFTYHPGRDLDTVPVALPDRPGRTGPTHYVNPRTRSPRCRKDQLEECGLHQPPADVSTGIPGLLVFIGRTARHGGGRTARSRSTRGFCSLGHGIPASASSTTPAMRVPGKQPAGVFAVGERPQRVSQAGPRTRSGKARWSGVVGVRRLQATGSAVADLRPAPRKPGEARPSGGGHPRFRHAVTLAPLARRSSHS